MKLIRNAVLDRLRDRRRRLQRQINKINGKRELPEIGFVEGDTWWASSYGWSLHWHRERLEQREREAAMTFEERLFADGWRPWPNAEDQA